MNKRKFGPGMTLRKALTYLLALILIPIVCLSQPAEKLTDYSINAGVYLNGNIYSSQFSQLPGIPNCCTEFRSAFGIGYTFYGGFIYRPESDILGKKYNLRLITSYSDLSANYSPKDFIGHIITGNSYTNADVEHSLKPSLSLISLEPALSVKLLDDFPLELRGGFQFGILLNKQFTQSENLISPQNVTFENGKRVRNEKSGDIPGASAIYFAPFLGLSLELFKSGNYTFNSEVQFNYGLTNAVKDLNWKIHSARLGLSVTYSIPAAIAVPPLSAPMPVLPLPEPPPPPEPLVLSISLTADNKSLSDKDTLTINCRERIYKAESHILPVIFYGGEPSKENAEAEESVLSAINKYLTNNKDTKLQIMVSQLDKDKINPESKVAGITNVLESGGIDKDRISVTYRNRKTGKNTREELLEESRKIEFIFSDGMKFLSESGTRTETNCDEPEFKVSTRLGNTMGAGSFRGSISDESMKIINTSFADEGNLKLKSETIDRLFGNAGSATIIISGKAIDEGNRTIDTTLTIYLKKNVAETSSFINLSGGSEQKYEELVLGYFNFDESRFSIINTSALDYIKNAISSGRKLTILPLTDNMGTPDHNKALSQARARAALELIGGKAEIRYPEDYLFTNQTPYGRALNRSVIVRIKAD